MLHHGQSFESLHSIATDLNPRNQQVNNYPALSEVLSMLRVAKAKGASDVPPKKSAS
jgi:hypothetical protein